jgi:hypothetical protein
METNTLPQPSKDLLSIKAFTDTIVVKGYTYYDSHSRLFNIIRLPAIMGYLFPQLKKRKIRFEIKCFADKQQLKEYLETTNNVPLVLNLFERDDDIQSCRP